MLAHPIHDAICVSGPDGPRKIIRAGGLIRRDRGPLPRFYGGGRGGNRAPIPIKEGGAP